MQQNKLFEHVIYIEIPADILVMMQMIMHQEVQTDKKHSIRNMHRT